MTTTPPIVRTKEWLIVYNACLKEFKPWEFGDEAYTLAAKAADTIMAEREQEKK